MFLSPYGAVMQSEFFSSLQIDQSHLSGALSGVCRPREQMKNNQANHCTLSDHRMFKEFSLGLHTCFCSLDHMVVVSICAQDQDKKWISTGEFEGTFVREKIIALCKSKIESSHQTMCGCSENLIPSEYISCLKDKASEAK